MKAKRKAATHMWAVVDCDGDAVAGYLHRIKALETLPRENDTWPMFAPHRVVKLVPEERGRKAK